ncbi:hypothetical protein RPPS3_25990 [Rhodopseudomonas palustris]|uniref:hypothetical protein n=1 Tax=Rhodopseudomonas palustris TaxID=1076 RepID=UPI000D1AEFEE|nr:hypothetical protein [Rhodopseudomonas palustris]AVT76662.1 hypothetical protein RPPS3_25990 [Rhodopseudomonas palustris]
MTINELVAAARKSRGEWLEDVLAGLLAAGCLRSEISVEDHPGGRTIVLVSGILKYEHEIKVSSF